MDTSCCMPPAFHYTVPHNGDCTIGCPHRTLGYTRCTDKLRSPGAWQTHFHGLRSNTHWQSAYRVWHNTLSFFGTLSFKGRLLILCVFNALGTHSLWVLGLFFFEFSDIWRSIQVVWSCIHVHVNYISVRVPGLVYMSTTNYCIFRSEFRKSQSWMKLRMQRFHFQLKRWII